MPERRALAVLAPAARLVAAGADPHVEVGAVRVERGLLLGECPRLRDLDPRLAGPDQALLEPDELLREEVALRLERHEPLAAVDRHQA